MGLKRNIARLMVPAMMLGMLHVPQVDASSKSINQVLTDMVLNQKNYKFESIHQELLDNGHNLTLSDTKAQLTDFQAGNSEKILADTGGFLTTLGMLNKKVDELFFVGTHNSFANNRDAESSYSDSFSTGTKNQYLSIGESLLKGVRFLDIDLGDQGNDSDHTKSYHKVQSSGKTKIQDIASSIRDFIDNNPNDILVVNISDIYNNPDLIQTLQGNATYNENDYEFYRHVNRFLKYLLRERSLADKTFNYFGQASTNERDMFRYVLHPGVTYNDGDHEYSMTEWPTLGEMIGQNKRLIIMLPTTYQSISKKTGYRKKYLGYKGKLYPYKNSDETTGSTTHQERVNPFNIAATLDGETSVTDRMFMISNTADGGSTAGWDPAARINNEGRRIYELVKAYNANFNGDDYANVIDLDFFRGSSRKGGRGTLEVDAVDAANRINYENTGEDWSQMETINNHYYWTPFPQEVDRITNDHVSVSSNISYTTWKKRPYHDRYDFEVGAQALIDGNVWSGYDGDSGIDDKDINFTFDKTYAIDKVNLNFYTGNDSVGYNIYATADGLSEERIASGTLSLSRDSAWYTIDIPGSIPANRLRLVLDTNNGGKHLKEVSFIGREFEGTITKKTLIPTDDAYVKRGKYGGNNYNHSGLGGIEISWDERNDHERHGYMKFDLTNISDADTALLKIRVDNKQSDDAPLIIYDLKNNNWSENTVTWDSIRHSETEEILRLTIKNDGYYVADLSDVVKRKLQQGETKLSLKFSIASGNKDDIAIASRYSTHPSELILYDNGVQDEDHKLYISPSHDAYVKRGKYGGNNYNNNRVEISYDKRSDHRRRGVMRFPLTNVGNVRSAKLIFYIDNRQSDSAPIELKNLTRSNWTETNVTWDNIRNNEDSVVKAQFTVHGDGWYEVDVTDWVKEQIRAGEDLNYMIRIVYGNQDNVEIYSKESDRVPKLIIEEY